MSLKQMQKEALLVALIDMLLVMVLFIYNKASITTNFVKIWALKGRCCQGLHFYREYPIVTALQAQLSWSHYLVFSNITPKDLNKHLFSNMLLT